MPTGRWLHVAVSVDRDDPTGLRFYVNGAPHGPDLDPTDRQGSLTNPEQLRIGATRTGVHDLFWWFFNGRIDEIELFNLVLTPDEVFDIWYADSLGKCKPVRPGICECGEWTHPLRVDYIIGGPRKPIFPGSAICGETVRLFTQGQRISIINFTGDFTCTGDANCLAEYTWELTDPLGALIKGGSGKNINVNFRASKYGDYTLIIQPICGNKECPPCEITFYVTTIQLPPLEKEKEKE